VLCTHGRTGATRLLLGSVACEVMRNALVPLLVIPPHVNDALCEDDAAENDAPLERKGGTHVRAI
jgi:hypothetical protein